MYIYSPVSYHYYWNSHVNINMFTWKPMASSCYRKLCLHENRSIVCWTSMQINSYGNKVESLWYVDHDLLHTKWLRFFVYLLSSCVIQLSTVCIHCHNNMVEWISWLWCRIYFILKYFLSYFDYYKIIFTEYCKWFFLIIDFYLFHSLWAPIYT